MPAVGEGRESIHLVSDKILQMPCGNRLFLFVHDKFPLKTPRSARLGMKGRGCYKGIEILVIQVRVRTDKKFCLFIYLAINFCIPEMLLKLFWELEQTQ